MAYQLSRRTVVLAKTESTSGTDAVPTAASNAMLLFGNMNPFSLDTSIVTKDVVRDSLTANKDLIGRQLANLTLETVLMSRGNSGGAPFFDPLLKASGMTVSTGAAGGSSSWVYSPVSTGFSTATIYTYLDGLLTKSFGCLGTFSLNMTAGQAPDLSFTLQGTYNNPTDQAMVSPTYPTDTKSMVQSAGLAIGSYNTSNGLVVRSLSLDLGAANAERGDVNSTYGFKGIALTSRAPTMNIVCEVEDTVGTKNFFTYLNSTQVSAADGSMDNITWSHGDGTQSKINFTVRAPQLTGVAFNDDNGIRTYSLDYKLRNNTSNNELEIAFIEKA